MSEEKETPKQEVQHPRGTRQEAQPRGAGEAAGERAVIERAKPDPDWPPESKPHAEVVKELEAQAEANEKYNNEQNAKQVAANKAFEEKLRQHQQ